MITNIITNITQATVTNIIIPLSQFNEMKTFGESVAIAVVSIMCGMFMGILITVHIYNTNRLKSHLK